MLHEMLVGAVDVIAQERATDATLFQAMPHHEVIDDQLTAPVEQIGKRPLALRRIEYVLLLNLHPGQRAPLGGNKIAHARERLLAFEMCLARREPFVLGHDSIVLHCSDSLSGTPA